MTTRSRSLGTKKGHPLLTMVVALGILFLTGVQIATFSEAGPISAKVTEQVQKSARFWSDIDQEARHIRHEMTALSRERARLMHELRSAKHHGMTLAIHALDHRRERVLDLNRAILRRGNELVELEDRSGQRESNGNPASHNAWL